MKLSHLAFLALTSISSAAPISGFAQNFDDVVSATFLTGWRQTNGTHIAAIQLDLAAGWHTYWRAPGDAGIPALLDPTGSQNHDATEILWPRPEVYRSNGMRSVVYEGRVVLPLSIRPTQTRKAIEYEAQLDIGVCQDICIPKTLHVRATLPATGGTRDARIVASLTDRPYSAAEAGVANVTCDILPADDGITLVARLSMDTLGPHEDVVIEAGNPLLWVSEPDTQRSGRDLMARSTIQHVEERPFILKREDVVITVLGSSEAVEIRGCARP